MFTGQEMSNRQSIQTTIELKLYGSEAHALLMYLIEKWESVQQLKAAAADQDFALKEYVLNKFIKDYQRIERSRSQKPKAIKMPISVARILWKNWQQEFISAPLQLVLQKIDGQLKNENLTPI